MTRSRAVAFAVVAAALACGGKSTGRAADAPDTVRTAAEKLMGPNVALHRFLEAGMPGFQQIHPYFHLRKIELSRGVGGDIARQSGLRIGECDRSAGQRGPGRIEYLSDNSAAGTLGKDQ